MIVRILTGSCLVLATVFSCGAKDDDNGESTSAPDMDGTWASECESDGNSGYAKTTVVITGGTAAITSGTYSDASCATAESLAVFSSTVTIGNAVTSPAGAKEHNSQITSITFTYKTDDQITAANAAGICGGGFVKDTPKVKTAADCSNDQFFGDQFNERFNVYKVDGNKFYMGECGEDGTATDCSAATKRPTTLDSSFYTKV